MAMKYIFDLHLHDLKNLYYIYKIYILFKNL